MRNITRHRFFPLGVTLLAVLGMLLFFLIPSVSRKGVDTTAGLSYLQEQETKSLDHIDQILQERGKKATAILPVEMQNANDAELVAMFEDLLEEIQDPETDIWSKFQDAAVIGDSRAVGFSYYGFMEESHVLADGGATIRNIEGYLPDLIALQPSILVLCFGINDVGIGIWPTPEDYAAEMTENLQTLHEKLPNTQIVVSSILPAIDPAFDKGPAWRNIPEYTAAVGEICEENDAIYVDNAQICAEHQDLYQPDGVHMREPFYDYWARNLMIGIVNHEKDIALA